MNEGGLVLERSEAREEWCKVEAVESRWVVEWFQLRFLLRFSLKRL